MQQQVEVNQDLYGGKEENILQDILSKYLPWWPLFAILIALGFGASWIYLKYATPIFESSASLLIKDQKKGLDDSNIMESLNLFGSKKIVENEIEVIRSRSIKGSSKKSGSLCTNNTGRTDQRCFRICYCSC